MVKAGVPDAASSSQNALSLEQLVSDWYRREFGVSVPRPAIFNDPRAVDCRGDGHLTTTAYLKTSTTSANLLVLYLTRDGLNLIKKTRRETAVPAGIIHVMSLVVHYAETTGSTPLAMWQIAQGEINNQHADFARSHGYPKPLVTFVNTNVLIEPTDLVRAQSGKEVLRAMLDERLVKPTEYDVLITINIDPSRSEGGRASFAADRSIDVGNYANWKTELDTKAWSAIARTAYQQLMAYWWGWETDWTPTCGGTRLGHEPFITSPRLLGWEDVDGDGIPEILDETPYGRVG
jgi:hypothetical protein